MSASVRRRGRAVSSWTLLGSVTVVAVAVLAFLITASPDRAEQAAGTPLASSPTQAQQPEPTPGESASTRPQEKPAKKKQQATKPSAYVEVFNNSGITGLAATAATELGGAGWDVIGTDNWYGDIPQSTVYYPQRLRAQAELLAGDIGTDRIKPAVDPMRLDRLTVILTGDL